MRQRDWPHLPESVQLPGSSSTTPLVVGALPGIAARTDHARRDQDSPSRSFPRMTTRANVGTAECRASADFSSATSDDVYAMWITKSLEQQWLPLSSTLCGIVEKVQRGVCTPSRGQTHGAPPLESSLSSWRRAVHHNRGAAALRLHDDFLVDERVPRLARCEQHTRPPGGEPASEHVVRCPRPRLLKQHAEPPAHVP